jgi:hypothetical protein
MPYGSGSQLRRKSRRLFVDRVLSGKSDYLRRLFGVEDGKRYHR